MKMEKRQYIGADIGGTAIKIGKFDYKGNLLDDCEVLMPQPSSPGAVTVTLCEILEKFDPFHDVDRVGISLPGPMDNTNRIARLCINLPGWENVPLADWLESRLSRKVTLSNDGNCALLGESFKGAAKGFKDVVLLTLGTGVGGGVMLDGKIFTGHNGVASEPGLIGLRPDGPKCNSGNNGSLEQFASSRAIERTSGVTPKELFRKAEIGDEEAIALWKDYGINLGIGISSLVYLFNPELVLLAGGISEASVYFLPFIENEINQRVHSVHRDGLVIRASKLRNRAGCFGAALTAIERL